MAFQPAPNVVQVELRGTYLGEQVENLLYFETPTTPTAAVVQEIAEQVEGWFITEVLPFLAPEYVWREAYARSLNTAAAPEYTSNANSGDTSAQDPPGLPGNVTWTIQFRTGLTGRSFRGRNYIPAIPPGGVSGNALTQAWADAFVAGYEALLTVASGFDWEWVVLSRQQGNVVLPNAIGAPVTEIGYADLFLDSQRRRLATRGD